MAFLHCYFPHRPFTNKPRRIATGCNVLSPWAQQRGIRVRYTRGAIKHEQCSNNKSDRQICSKRHCHTRNAAKHSERHQTAGAQASRQQERKQPTKPERREGNDHEPADKRLINHRAAITSVWLACDCGNVRVNVNIDGNTSLLVLVNKPMQPMITRGLTRERGGTPLAGRMLLMSASKPRSPEVLSASH